MLREARFTVPAAIWDELDPDDSLDIDGLDWELYDSEDVLIDAGGTVNVSHSPSDRGERFRIEMDVDVPEAPGTYELYLEVLGAYSYTEFIERTAQGPEIDDHYTIRDSIRVPVDKAVIVPRPEEGAEWPAVPWSLHKGNEEIAGEEDVAQEEGAEAWHVDLDFSDSVPSLDPYSLIVGGDGGYVDHRVFRINPSILAAARDLRSLLDRLNRKVRLDSLQFADADYLNWLRLGMDYFNALPPVTDFRMTKATGPIRSHWLMASQLQALRVRYLEEGLTQYDYSGAAVTLTVDVTTYLESLASTLESRLEQAERFKVVAARRGIVGGSGEWSLRNRNTGVVGITLGPVSGYGRGRLYRRI